MPVSVALSPVVPRDWSWHRNGWGVGDGLGAIKFVMPVVTTLMIVVPAFAAAVLGGLESPAGAVIGGLFLGVFLNLLGQYVGFARPELRLPIAFAVLLLVLLVKPNGLFGRKQVRRV